MSLIYQHDILAWEECEVARISKHELEKALGGSIESVRTQNEVEQILDSVELFNNIDRQKLTALVHGLKLNHYYQQDFIFEQYTHGDTLYIIKEGTVTILKNGVEIRSLDQGAYFGERSII